eukprot:637951-Pyramimonas_sp.AAC.1
MTSAQTQALPVAAAATNDVQPSNDLPVNQLLQSPLAQLLWGVGRGLPGHGQPAGAPPQAPLQGTPVTHRMGASLVNTADRDALLAQPAYIG